VITCVKEVVANTAATYDERRRRGQTIDILITGGTGDVVRHQHHTVRQGDRGDEQIIRSNKLPRRGKICSDRSIGISGTIVEGQRDEAPAKVLNQRPVMRRIGAAQGAIEQLSRTTEHN
jgi:hypothetical protein